MIFLALLAPIPSDISYISCSDHVGISVFTRFRLAVFAAASWAFLQVKVLRCIGASRLRIEQKRRSWRQVRAISRRHSFTLHFCVSIWCGMFRRKRRRKKTTLGTSSAQCSLRDDDNSLRSKPTPERVENLHFWRAVQIAYPSRCLTSLNLRSHSPVFSIYFRRTRSSP